MEITINITENAKELIELAKSKPIDNEHVELYLTPEEYDKLMDILERNHITLEEYFEKCLKWSIENPEELKEWLNKVKNK